MVPLGASCHCLTGNLAFCTLSPVLAPENISISPGPPLSELSRICTESRKTAIYLLGSGGSVSVVLVGDIIGREGFSNPISGRVVALGDITDGAISGPGRDVDLEDAVERVVSGIEDVASGGTPGSAVTSPVGGGTLEDAVERVVNGLEAVPSGAVIDGSINEPGRVVALGSAVERVVSGVDEVDAGDSAGSAVTIPVRGGTLEIAVGRVIKGLAGVASRDSTGVSC